MEVAVSMAEIGAIASLHALIAANSSARVKKRPTACDPACGPACLIALGCCNVRSCSMLTFGLHSRCQRCSHSGCPTHESYDCIDNRTQITHAQTAWPV